MSRVVVTCTVSQACRAWFNDADGTSWPKGWIWQLELGGLRLVPLAGVVCRGMEEEVFLMGPSQRCFLAVHVCMIQLK